MRLAIAFYLLIFAQALFSAIYLAQSARITPMDPVAAAALSAPVFPERERIEPCPKKSVPMRDEVLGTFQFTPRCAYSGASPQEDAR